MYTLYARPNTGSAVVEAILEMAQAPYRIEPDTRNPDAAALAALKAVNPLAQVPVLVLPDGTVMTESCAIVMHLADTFPGLKLAPNFGDPQRATYLRWMVFLAANIYMTDLRITYPARYTADPNGADAVKAAALQRKAAEWQVFADALGRRTFMLGTALSAIDLYAAMLASWNIDVPAFFASFPNIKTLYDQTAAILAVRAVWQRNEMPV